MVSHYFKELLKRNFYCHFNIGLSCRVVVFHMTRIACENVAESGVELALDFGLVIRLVVGYAAFDSVG